MADAFINRYNSFCKAVSNLSPCIGANPEDTFVLPGTAQCFNLAFDLAWKVMKDVLTKKMGIISFITGSPRDVLSTAFSNGLITNEVWLDMLRTRNLLVHDYDGEIALKKFSLIVDVYYPELCLLRDTLYHYYDSSDDMNFF